MAKNSSQKGVLPRYSPENIETQNSTSAILNKEKEPCKDLVKRKTCKKLEKKNNGKGCKKQSIMTKCPKTCGLCGGGKYTCITYH